MPSPSPDERARSTTPRGDSIPRHRSRSPKGDRERDERRRARSRSPARIPKAKNFSGLKWKKQDRREDDRDDRRGGYRDRDGDRRRDDRHRGYDRFDRRDRDNRRDRFDTGSRDDRRDRDRRQDRDDRPRDDRPPRDSDRDRDRKPKSDKPKPAPVSAAPGEPMIIVTVNDRLGTKAQIPCLASDPIKVFKAMVAARIGRAPHEIMLKRQGERPMKDQLTLQDYGVSHGVQLDLELDTGD